MIQSQRQRARDALRIASTFTVAMTALALGACAGGPSAEETAAMATAPIPSDKARVMIERKGSLLYAAAPATIELNGQKVASVGPGGSAVFDVPSGANVIAASAWSYPGTLPLEPRACERANSADESLDAKGGETYKIIVELRGASFGPGVLGPIGGAIDAASNEIAGADEIRVAFLKSSR